MFKEIIKITFLQIWDNSLLLFIGNIFLMLCYFVIFLLATHSTDYGSIACSIGFIIILVILLILYELYAIIIVYFTSKVVTTWSMVLGAAKRITIPSLLFVTSSLCIASLLWFSFESTKYIGVDFRTIIILLLGWITVIWMQLSMMYIVLIVLFNGDLINSCRLSLILVFVYPINTLLTFIVFILIVISSIAILPGLGGSIILLKNALQFQVKMLNKKNTSKSSIFKVNTKYFVEEENITSGYKSIKNILFPWKT